MDQFFRDTISNLPLLGGVNQEQKLGGHFAALVKELVSVCDEFNLSEKVKQKVILDGIRKDKEFYGLNGRVVYRYLIQYVEDMKLKAPQSHVDISEIQRKNKEFYTDWLKKKKKKNPDYDPIVEAKKVFEEMANKKVERNAPGAGTRIRRSL